MSGCCGPDTPKVYRLKVGGEVVGLIGVEQAFQDINRLGLEGKKAAKKILEKVEENNYIPKTAKRQYRKALLEEYNNYMAKTK